MAKYEVWSEGYCATGEKATAQRLTRDDEDTLWEGETFKDACINAMQSLGWDIENYYNEKTNSYWACKFYDNEADARRYFG